MADESRSVSLDRAKQRLGTILRDKWQVHSLLGVGGMAAVYSATHRNGKRAAIKVLHPEFCAQPQFVSRFLREGYVANKIEHPASVAILDDDVCEDGAVFLVMELLEGDSLDRYTRRHGPRRLPLDRVLAMADDVLDLLIAAHALGIIHRDLKPANVFLTADNRVKVLDFGIARLAERTLDTWATQTGAAMGTPAYMPPEQARGRWNLVDARTDLWALGATAFALIAGDRPRRAETVQEELLLAMTAPLPSLAIAAPSCPPDVVAWVDRAVSYEMDARWPDAATMQGALREVTRGASAFLRDEKRAAVREVTSTSEDPGPFVDVPSQPSAGRLRDTAPVLVEEAQRQDPSTHLTAGGTFGPPRRASRSWASWVPGALVVGGMAVVGFMAMVAVDTLKGNAGPSESKASAVAASTTATSAASASEAAAPVPPPTGEVGHVAIPGAILGAIPSASPATAERPRPPPPPTPRPDPPRVPARAQGSPPPPTPTVAPSSKPRSTPAAPDPLDQRF